LLHANITTGLLVPNLLCRQDEGGSQLMMNISEKKYKPTVISMLHGFTTCNIPGV
jgi:hypothetical protein